MKTVRALVLISSLCLVAPALTGSTSSHRLDQNSFEEWRDFILPDAREMKWKEIPWHESFWKGLLEAQQKNKPLLLWAMNGHPLGCT
jgi:hypothetical protein